MQANPHQTQNIATRQPEETRKLTDAYTRWFADVTHQLQPVPPAPVGYSNGGTVVLNTPEARFSGNISNSTDFIFY